MALLGWALHASLARRHHRQTIIIGSTTSVRIHTHDRSITSKSCFRGIGPALNFAALFRACIRAV